MTSQFTGTSENGSLDEAIANAIAAAKLSISSDYIEWTLRDVYGKNGGYVLINEITVTIQVIRSAP